MSIRPAESPVALDQLSRLAIRHGSDKFGAHVYTPHYDDALRHLRQHPVRLLEIGIGGYEVPNAGGSSLRMWADYFPSGTIVGLDFHEKNLDLPSHVFVERGSQDDAAVLDRLNERYGPFDIVIDDGSHDPRHIVHSFLHLYPSLGQAGFYIVEDTQLAFRPELGGDNAGQGSIFALANLMTLSMHAAEGHRPADERLAELGRITKAITILRNAIIFRRGANTYPSNLAFDLGSPEVVAVYDAIERQAAHEPGPRAVLSRIDMNIWGRRTDEAEALAIDAASAYPQETALLAELERMMRWAGKQDAAQLIGERLRLQTGSKRT